MNKVSIETHEAVIGDLPDEVIDKDLEDGFRRPDVPPPNIWKRAVVVTNKATGRKAVVASLDLMTRQFRGYYPDTQERDPRTTWQQFDEWNPEVRFTQVEMERQQAAKVIETELETMDAKELALIQVLAESDDPRKMLGKIEALRMAGMIRPRPDAPAAALTTETKKGK